MVVTSEALERLAGNNVSDMTYFVSDDVKTLLSLFLKRTVLSH